MRERAGSVIRSAVIAGTTALRSHVDVDTIGGLTGLEGVAAARDDHADLCSIQLVAFPQEGIWRDPGTDALMEEAMRAGADVVGGMPHWEADHEAARRHIAFCLDLAERHDADVDMHVDETDDGRWRSFEILVEEADRRGWGPRTTAGHVCAMAAWEDDYAAAVIARAAAAGVMVATNPPTNLMLQGREDREPRRRGIPRIKELLAAGVTVGAGQDCVDDAFYPFGTADPLQVALIVAHAAQLGTAARSPPPCAWSRPTPPASCGSPTTACTRARAPTSSCSTPRPRATRCASRLRGAGSLRGGRVVAETVREQRLHRAVTGHGVSSS